MLSKSIEFELYTQWLIHNTETILKDKKSEDIICDCILYDFTQGFDYRDYNSLIDDEILRYLESTNKNTENTYKIVSALSIGADAYRALRYEIYRKRLLRKFTVAQKSHYENVINVKIAQLEKTQYLQDYTYQALKIIYESDKLKLQSIDSVYFKHSNELDTELYKWEDNTQVKH